MSKQLSEVAFALMRAKELIEQRGWCQGQREDEKGRLCSLGAIMETTEVYERGGRLMPSVHRIYFDAINMLVKAMRGRSMGAGTIAAWNDHPKRKKGDVLAAFDRAIKLSLDAK